MGGQEEWEGRRAGLVQTPRRPVILTYKSSNRHYYQIVRARDLEFETKFTNPCVSHVTCPVSGVGCHMSQGRCQVSLKKMPKDKVYI